MPEQGRIAVFVTSWYSGLVLNPRHVPLSTTDHHHLARIREFESQLSRQGIHLLKFWFPISREQQAARLHAAKPENGGEWQAFPTDEYLLQHHAQIMQTAEVVLDETQDTAGGWHRVDTDDEKERQLAVGIHLYRAMQDALEHGKETPAPPASPPNGDGARLARIGDHPSLEKHEYEARLSEQIDRLKHLAWRAHASQRSLILVFEGWDAGGKGGVIKRLLRGIDTRIVKVIPVGPPTEEENRYPYLWRFWRTLPRAGDITIYDRSWYGRVLVERVEGLVEETLREWAYHEINDFEQQLLDYGAITLKFWLHIDADEQLRRFRERERKPHKRHKITADDWRNREKRPDYERALHDMLLYTHLPQSPWHVIPANSKRYARVHILETICDHLEDRLPR